MTLPLQGRRRVFLRFASELNPGLIWDGDPDRRYGKTDDGTGEIPVHGTVETFGELKNALVNREFPIEIPSITPVLLDPDNDWRAAAERPSYLLLKRRVGFYLRENPDTETSLDTLLALGQIGTPRFPPPANVQLNITVPGGSTLGDVVPRRLLTTADWPRALPDHLARVIPMVVGSLTNAVAPTVVVQAPAPSGSDPYFAYKSTFVKSGGTGQQTVFGLPGTPKVVIFWSDNSTASVFSADFEVMLGWTDGIRQGARHNISADNSGGAECAQSVSDVGCVFFADKNENVKALASVVGFANGQFTLNWSNNDGRASVIHYLAIGGSNVRARADSFTSAPGAQSITGVGFRPTGVLTLGGFNPAANATIDFGSGQSFGATAGPGKNVVAAFFSEDGVSPTNTKRKQRHDACLSTNQVLVYPPAPPINPCQEAACTSLDADGFTLTYASHLCAPYRMLFLALGGVNVDVGTLLQPTATGEQTLPLAFTPDALLLQSTNRTTDATAAGTAGSVLSVGGTDGTRQGGIWAGDANGVTPSRAARYSKTGALLTLASVNGTGGSASVDAEVSLTRFEAGAAILNWGVVDATPREILYVAVGEADAPPATPGVTLIETPLCGDAEDGASDQGGAARGGYLKGLLVDTGGGTVGISDYPFPTDLAAAIMASAYAAPTLSGVLVPGGFGGAGASVYYAAATVHGGVLSELSNVVGPFVSTATDQKVDLTISGAAPGGNVRIFRSSTPSFGIIDRYRTTGYPYSENDLPAGTTTVSDEYMGIDTRTQSDPDPHWDLNYPHTYLYEISTLYANGVESSCSAAVAVPASPRNEPLNIRVTWSAEATGPAAVVGRRVRRMTQSYVYPAVPSRQWDLAADVFELIDPLTENTSVLPCATEAEDNNKPVYCFAGHTLSRYREVFVLKPSPTSENKEFVQVMMIEGTDYTREIREVNGNRYDCLVFTEQQRSDTCQYYEVSANVDGADTNADGTGTLIVEATDVLKWLFYNVIFNTYRSSVGPYAPAGGRWFTDVPYAAGLVDESSFAVAKIESQRRVPPNGYPAAGAIITTLTARQLVQEFISSFGLDLYQYHGMWGIELFNPRAVVRGSVSVLGPENGVLKDTFEPEVEDPKQFNLMPYFAGPIQGDGSQGYLVAGQVKDDISFDRFGMLVTEPLYFWWTQDPTTAYDVAYRHLQWFKYPPINGYFKAPVPWYDLRNGQVIAVTARAGLSRGGWVNRVCRVLRNDLDLDGILCNFKVRDIDAEVP